jgi:hypothetical protein
MKKDTNLIERLETAIDELTEENQQYVLGVLGALNFAQHTQDVNESGPVKEANPGAESHAD